MLSLGFDLKKKTLRLCLRLRFGLKSINFNYLGLGTSLHQARPDLSVSVMISMSSLHCLTALMSQSVALESAAQGGW